MLLVSGDFIERVRKLADRSVPTYSYQEKYSLPEHTKIKFPAPPVTPYIPPPTPPTPPEPVTYELLHYWDFQNSDGSDSVGANTLVDKLDHYDGSIEWKSGYVEFGGYRYIESTNPILESGHFNSFSISLWEYHKNKDERVYEYDSSPFYTICTYASVGTTTFSFPITANARYLEAHQLSNTVYIMYYSVIDNNLKIEKRTQYGGIEKTFTLDCTTMLGESDKHVYWPFMFCVDSNTIHIVGGEIYYIGGIVSYSGSIITLSTDLLNYTKSDFPGIENIAGKFSITYWKNCCCSDGNYLYLADAWDGTINICDIQDGYSLKDAVDYSVYYPYAIYYHDGFLYSIAYDEDGYNCILQHSTGTVDLINQSQSLTDVDYLCSIAVDNSGLLFTATCNPSILVVDTENLSIVDELIDDGSGNWWDEIGYDEVLSVTDNTIIGDSNVWIQFTNKSDIHDAFGAIQSNSVFIDEYSVPENFDGKWHHQVYIMDNESRIIRVYFDGVEKPIIDAPIALPISASTSTKFTRRTTRIVESPYTSLSKLGPSAMYSGAIPQEVVTSLYESGKAILGIT